VRPIDALNPEILADRVPAAPRPEARESPLEAENRELTDEVGVLRDRQTVLEGLALRDPLTMLLNRRALSEQLAAELARAERGGYPVALVAVDVDHFKQVNDLHGHSAGDEVLRRVAERLTAGVRPGDLCARVGGDEFTLCLVDADAALAKEILARLAAAIASLEFAPGHEPLGFSAGIAEFPRHGEAPEELTSSADDALYRAKAGGRDRICVSTLAEATASALEPGTVDRHRHNVQNTVEALARAVDARNGYTHLHSQAVAFYAAALGRAAGMSEERVDLVRRAGVLHDVGKIGVPDTILWKAGSLTLQEVQIMREHSAVGYHILLGAGLSEIADWVAHLHERPDGRGYPKGLAGKQIPFESRLLKVADALDAMTSPRVYRTALRVDEALHELGRGAGTEFDLDLVARLVELVEGGELQVRGRQSPPPSPTARSEKRPESMAGVSFSPLPGPGDSEGG